jgi:predicted DNA-binding transcriptional regulator YafY
VRELGQPAIDALLKLEQILPTRLQKQVRTFLDAVTAPLSALPAVSADALMALARACRETERVTFEYAGPRGTGTRNVDPCGIVHVSGRWYLVAWDLERNDFRTFRVDRITSEVRRENVPAVPRTVPGGDLAAYVSRSVGSAAYSAQVRVVLLAPLEQLQQRLSPMYGTLTRRDAVSCEFVTGGHSLRSVALHLAMIDCDFEVLEPPELLDEMAAVCRRFEASRRAFGGSKRAAARAREE